MDSSEKEIRVREEVTSGLCAAVGEVKRDQRMLSAVSDCSLVVVSCLP